MVEPSFLTETCTPSSFCPVAEVIEPVSNWSAEAVVAAPTRTTLATLANNWHRKFVMMFLSSGLLDSLVTLRRWREGKQRPCPHAGKVGKGRAVAWHSQHWHSSTYAERSDRPISLCANRMGSDAVLKTSTGEVASSARPAHAEPQVC